MQGKVGISQSHSWASHSASLAAVCRCWLFRGSCSDPASIGSTAVWQSCEQLHIFCMCVYMFFYLVHHWDFSVSFSLSPESGLSRKQILGCIINLFECWLLGGKCWILLPFSLFSLPCVSSSEKLETDEEFTTSYVSPVFHSQALQQCWEVSNKEQAGCGTSTCCNSPEKRTTEYKHAGICLFPSLQELLCREWKTNDSLMV